MSSQVSLIYIAQNHKLQQALLSAQNGTPSILKPTVQIRKDSPAKNLWEKKGRTCCCHVSQGKDSDLKRSSRHLVQWYFYAFMLRETDDQKDGKYGTFTPSYRQSCKKTPDPTISIMPLYSIFFVRPALSGLSNSKPIAGNAAFLLKEHTSQTQSKTFFSQIW